MQIIPFGIFPTLQLRQLFTPTVYIYDDSAVYADFSRRFTPETVSSS